MKKNTVSTNRGPSKVRTLAIDIGGTGIKGSILDSRGKMVAERIRVKTPYPFRPNNLLTIIQKIARSLPAYDRISMGFPGVVRDGCIITAPHFNTKHWKRCPLAERVSKLLKKPARVLNDADVQGFGAIKGRGLEVVLTLGTGVGSSIFTDGKLAPHMELAHHPIHDNKTYDEYLGNDALRRIDRKKWNQRVRHMIAIVHTLLNYDTLYIGGGNAKKITGKLPSNVRISSNDAGITGGVHLWDK